MKKLNLLLSGLLLLVPFHIEAKSPPPGTGKADVPANIYIMLDTSGSMGANVPSTNPNRMYYPRDVAVDSSGNIFSVEYYYNRIRKMDSKGNLIKTFSPRIGSGYSRLRYSHKIAIDSNDNVYVSDRDNNRIVKFNNDGQWQRNFTGMNSRAEGVTVDSSGNVYGNTRTKIYKWDSSGNLVVSVAVDNSYGISWYGGSIYATERTSRQIKKFTDALVLQDTWSINQSTLGDIEVTSNGIYVHREGYTALILKYSLAGAYQKQWGTRSGKKNTNLYYLYGIGSDSSGNIYAGSFHENIVKKFTPDGVYKQRWGIYENRMTEALKVIDKLTSNVELTTGANFGMQDWNSSATRRVDIDKFGAGKVNLSVNEKIMVNGVLKDNDDYKYSSWYMPRGGTNLDSAMLEAQRYFYGTHGNKSPINSAAGCQKNFLIVISDGQWYGSKAETIARALLLNKGIETMVIGFHSGGNKAHYIKLAKAGGTYPETPLFANNWQHLYETMSAYIRQAISSRLTFSAPVVMPNISSGDHIFQSTFEYQNKHMWKGHLTKFELTSTGQIGALKWDAGLKLDDKSESSRKIWTILPSQASNNSNSFSNSFHTNNLTELKTLLWEDSGVIPTDTQASNLIKYVRGLDAYDENLNGNTTEKRWKLGDIYNSRLAVVGRVNAKVTSSPGRSNTSAFYRNTNDYNKFRIGNSCGNVNKCAFRKEVVYVGANDGMLHAFDSTTGEELWAFIPPSKLRSLRDIIASKANTANAIYGVDGSPIVKDIFYGNKWRTVLISGMGKGGYGYFALDITNPDIPKFLFAFDNDPSEDLIRHWDDAGTLTKKYYPPTWKTPIDPEYDYSKVGEALSVPVIIPMPYGANKTKWVAVFGGGYNGGINTFYGSAIYVIDLENDGKVLKRINLTDSSASLLINSMPADLVSITPDTTGKADYKGSMIYGADLEGKQWKLNLTNKGNLYDFTPLFNAEATVLNDRMEFFQVTPTIGSDKKLWSFYGTGNQQRLQDISPNIKNRIFGLKDKNFPLFAAANGLANTASSVLTNVSASGACPSANSMGWYLNLETNEKITGKIGLFNEVLYASRYLPKKGQICSPGIAALTEHDMSCGNQSRRTELGEGIATGAVIHNNVIYIGISGKGSGDIKDDQGNVIGKKTNNLIVITPAAGNSLGNGKITQESWREVY